MLDLFSGTDFALFVFLLDAFVRNGDLAASQNPMEPSFVELLLDTQSMFLVAAIGTPYQ